jgi:mannose-6-phosphate isomerase-like protein (cupin superfamily)
MSLTLQVIGPDAADERREFALGRFEVFNLGNRVLGRAVYHPGWRWSQHVGAAHGTAWCEIEHVGFVLAGRAAVQMRDGTETELTAGNWFTIPAGHDSWVLGDDDYVSLHILGADAYAAPPLPQSTDLEASPVSPATVEASAWGEGCRGWTLLSQPDLHVMEEEMAAASQERRHLHSATTQVYYVLAGTAITQVGNTSVSVRPGEAISIRPGNAHQIRNEADAPLRFLVISSGPPRSDRQDLP